MKKESDNAYVKILNVSKEVVVAYQTVLYCCMSAEGPGVGPAGKAVAEERL